MKHLATKERRKEVKEWIYLHRIHLAPLMADSKSYRDHEPARWIDKAIKEVGWSLKTARCDIWSSLHRYFRQMEADGLINEAGYKIAYPKI